MMSDTEAPSPASSIFRRTCWMSSREISSARTNFAANCKSAFVGNRSLPSPSLAES